VSKEIKKLTKQEKEKIENRLLAVFATALGSVMVLMYLMNWFQGSPGFIMASRVLIYVLLILSIALSVFLGIKAKKFKEKEQFDRAVKYKNWYYVTLTAAIASFIIYPTEIIARIFGWIRLGGIGNGINQFINNIHIPRLTNISSRIVVIMVLIGIYTISAFIYYGMLTRRAHRASLNKGRR
jgi:hypothetical protein